ncbi:MAG: DNA primase [candidate division KSB1 bacterium]|nr:DNA primase [candidate division KSB1 bacterium]
MRSIPPQIIDEVRFASDIVAVVSDYVTLKKSGRNFFGLCPFHPEKTPSFSVNPDKQIFHCFGCGAGGNVFTFIQRQQGVGFPEAVRVLAKRAGLSMPEPEAEDASAVQEKEALYFVHQLAAEFFQAALFSEAGQPARDYLKQRGFDEPALQAFGVGYAPSSWEALVKHAQRKSVNPEILLQAGLINRRDQEGGDRGAGFYDRFRHRIMFPIHNLSGSVVAFGGRRLPPEHDDSPKYLNSPETPIYHKGQILYGLYQAREAVRAADRVIVVEGYLDLIRMHRCGFQNTVATSGTALTEHQARLMLRYTKNVTLLFDSDVAGAAATLRGADILVEHGLVVSVATLSAGNDPDSFLLKRPVEEMQQLLQSAPPLLEFKILRGAGASPGDAITQRTEQLRSIVETLARVRDGLERQALVHNLAERLHVDEALLWEEVSRLRRTQFQRPATRRLAKEAGSEKSESASGASWSSVLPGAESSFLQRTRAAEEELLRIMILHPEAIRFIFSFMRVEDFQDPEMRALATRFCRLLDEEHQVEAPWLADPEMLLHHFTEPKQAEFVSRTIHSYNVSVQADDRVHTSISQVDYRRWSADCMARLQMLKLEEHVHALREQIKNKEKAGEEVTELMQEVMAYQEQRKRIRPENFL